MNIGMDTSEFSDTTAEPEDDTDLQRLHYSREVAQLDRQEVLSAVLDALDSDTSPVSELIDDELGFPTLPDERVQHNAMVWQKMGQALHTIVAAQVQAKVQVRMARP